VKEAMPLKFGFSMNESKNKMIGSPSVDCRVFEELRQGTIILVQDESARKFEYIASSKLVENADVKDIIVILRKKVK
jgi:hypothetical protein